MQGILEKVRTTWAKREDRWDEWAFAVVVPLLWVGLMLSGGQVLLAVIGGVVLLAGSLGVVFRR